jgi:hypothetical protein
MGRSRFFSSVAARGGRLAGNQGIHIVSAFLVASMLLGCRSRCSGELDDPCAPALPSAVHRGSTSAPEPTAGSSSGGASAGSGSVDMGTACAMPAGVSSEPWTAFVNVDGETCDIASATGESGESGGWAVFVCARCPSLGVVSVHATGDEGVDYPAVCNDDGATAAVEVALCPASGAQCGASAPRSCTITSGPSSSNDNASIDFAVTVMENDASHDVVAYVAPPP